MRAIRGNACGTPEILSGGRVTHVEIAGPFGGLSTIPSGSKKKEAAEELVVTEVRPLGLKARVSCEAYAALKRCSSTVLPNSRLRRIEKSPLPAQDARNGAPSLISSAPGS